MPYWNTPKNAMVNLDSNTMLQRTGTKNIEFYEIEPAIVLDIILDKNHPYFQEQPQHTLNSQQWPIDVVGQPVKNKDPDYTWIGRALVRLYYSQQMVEKEDLVWAIPFESNISEYPLLNEVVGVVAYLGRYYYTRKINLFNWPNLNADFSIEKTIGGFNATSISPIDGNRELMLDSDPEAPYRPFQGPTSYTAPVSNTQFRGVLGRYFYINKNVRSLKHREGDLVIESRFGQSIRFGAYDDNRDNDKGYNSDFSGYKDYKGDGTVYTVEDNIVIGSGGTDGGYNSAGRPVTKYEAGGGNPMILIRNRQRPILENGKTANVYENLPTAKGTIDEKNVGGYILEDINNDGSSIHITSGVTISQFKTNCSKKMWGVGEEQTQFLPTGATPFVYPILSGDQIVVNTDRMIISAKKAEMLQFSKKRMAFVTDDELTIDAHNQIVINTNNKTVINSPAIYLGEYNQTNEPVLLGQTSVNWMYDLCQWLLLHTHWFSHNHPDAQGGTTGDAQANKTQTTVQDQTLITLRDKLNTLMSRRVFTTGGGFAPGQNGGTIPNGSTPTTIGVLTGTGVPGGFDGQNRKYSSSETPEPAVQAGSAASIVAAAQAAENIKTVTSRDGSIIEYTSIVPTVDKKAYDDASQDAAEATATSQIVKTQKAKNYANKANSAVKNAKNQNDQAQKFLDDATIQEKAAQAETDPVVKSKLMAKVNSDIQKATPHLDKAKTLETETHNDKLIVDQELINARATGKVK
jgi:hypothetical protein